VILQKVDFERSHEFKKWFLQNSVLVSECLSVVTVVYVHRPVAGCTHRHFVKESFFKLLLSTGVRGKSSADSIRITVEYRMQGKEGVGG